MATMVTLTIRNNHTGTTFRERVTVDTMTDRIRWYNQRGRQYPTADGRPGWVVTDSPGKRA